MTETSAVHSPFAASHDPRELISQLRDAAHPASADPLIDWTGDEGLFNRAADVIERLLQGPSCWADMIER